MIFSGFGRSCRLKSFKIIWNGYKLQNFHRLIRFEYICSVFNSSNQKITIMAYKISEDCTACGSCIDECPVEAISEGDIYKIDPDVCTDCGACVAV